MKTMTKESCWSPLKRRLLMSVLLLGITGNQVGCGCECAGAAAVVGLATPIILIAREAQEAKKTNLEIERLEAEKRSHGNPP